jgi:endothelin-converting enzyme
LNPWWSNETSAAFANATQCLVEQYNAFALTPLNTTAGAGPRERIRGFLTLGENLADQGGLAISLDALRLEQAKEKEDTAAAQYEVDAMTTYMQLQTESSGTRSQQALEEMQRAAPELTKFDEDQLFFVAYAQSWCRYVRPSAFLRALESDPHSPSEARVNVPLSNSRTFREAFGCAITPEQEKFAHCVVW